MDWDMRDKIYEARWYTQAMKDVCQVMETPSVTDIPKSVFLIMEVVCERILSLLPKLEDTVQ